MKIYQHYKGGIYIELARGFLESSLERGDGTHVEMVTYQAVHNKVNYVRPAKEFDGMVDYPAVETARPVPRFKRIGDTP